MSRKLKDNPHGDPIAMVATCIKLFRDLPATYDEAYDLVGQADHECQDLLHEVELLNLSRKDTAEVLGALRDNRAIRRNAKDFMTIAKPLRDFITKNRHLIVELTQIQREMEKLSRNLNGRLYIPRVRHEKQEEFIAVTASETGKSPEAIRADLQKSGVQAGYDEAAAGTDN